ncbi:glutathione S-transferase C-terminal domain-containing protein [Sneathiella glossodoripedis]|uniref:glutathione S-transferase C-terminal domain-containing protein n=1 Tax=Sneathiella glossodoripedis TaxID=418853 RepID=UPI00068457F7|nr:glutathione S-transferase C-terminal domain-containing protein [Sneathiella glossodoripedis]
MDSMSIFEFATENSQNGPMWPEEKYARAHARSICAEMHAGFAALREYIPMNMSRLDPPAPIPSDVQNDIDRILEIWSDCRKKYQADGPYLFGKLSLADAAFAPVAVRFRSRSVPVPELCAAYIDAIYQQPDFIRWKMDADKETWVIDQ